MRVLFYIIYTFYFSDFHLNFASQKTTNALQIAKCKPLIYNLMFIHPDVYVLFT